MLGHDVDDDVSDVSATCCNECIIKLRFHCLCIHTYTYLLNKRFPDRYGWQRVRRWQFESWNEPDLRTFNTLDLDYSGTNCTISFCTRALRIKTMHTFQATSLI